jgi:AraC family transcriptional regulator
MLLFHPRSEEHSDLFDDAHSTLFSIEISSGFVEQGQPRQFALDQQSVFRGGKAVTLAKRVFKEFSYPDAASGIAIEGLVLELLAEAARGRTNDRLKPSPRLGQAIDFLHAHFRESVNLGDLARYLGLHPVYLARAFRRQLGSSVGDYVRKLRIEYACKRLVESDEPVTFVAHSAGFYDQSHFCREFRRQIGTSPTAYRRSAARKQSGAPSIYRVSGVQA